MLQAFRSLMQAFNEICSIISLYFTEQKQNQSIINQWFRIIYYSKKDNICAANIFMN